MSKWEAFVESKFLRVAIGRKACRLYRQALRPSWKFIVGCASTGTTATRTEYYHGFAQRPAYWHTPAARILSRALPSPTRFAQK